MKAKFNKAALQEALTLVASVVPSRTPKPILQCVRITTGKDGVDIRATDLEVGISFSVTQVEIEQEGDAVVPADKLKETALGLAEKIAAKGMPAITGALRAIGGGLDATQADGLALESKVFGDLCATADKAEGTRAFLEKRKPNFQDK